VIEADDKKRARLNLIRHVLSRVDCPEKDEHAAKPDEEVVFAYSQDFARQGRLAP
jgi:hypothetical protein